tara:strand:- start:891 stop:1127 length:237 start_codon:yes stop_codon:yes gene_type:complete
LGLKLGEKSPGNNIKKMNYTKDKISKESNHYQNYDMFQLYFGFKSDSLNTYEKNRVRDRYGAKAKKLLKEKNEEDSNN